MEIEKIKEKWRELEKLKNSRDVIYNFYQLYYSFHNIYFDDIMWIAYRIDETLLATLICAQKKITYSVSTCFLAKNDVNWNIIGFEEKKTRKT